MKTVLRNNRGISLVVVIMIMTLLLSMTAASLLITGIDSRATSNLKTGTAAFYIAEVGVQRALQELNQGITPTTTGSIGSGVYAVAVTDVTTPITGKQIVATGYIPNQSSPQAVRGIVVLAKTISSGGQFKYAAFGNTLLKLDGGGFTDSYDSSKGPYGGANVTSKGQTASNATIDIGDFTVKGDATSGGVVTNPAKVTGTATQNAPIQNFSTPACPLDGYTPTINFGGAGGSYDPSTGVLKVTSGNLTLPAPGTYYFKDVSVSSGATLSIGNAAVNIYINRKLTINGGSLVNGSTLPGNLIFWGCGSDNTDWALQSADAYATFYGMKHTITIGGGTGDLFGSAYGSTIKIKGGAKIHYDQALSAVGGVGSTYSVVSWKESSF
jgi:hypothetical protein